MLQLTYAGEVMQIIGAVLLIAIGVGVIGYTLLRKTPAAQQKPTAETEAAGTEPEAQPEAEYAQGQDQE